MQALAAEFRLPPETTFALRATACPQSGKRSRHGEATAEFRCSLREFKNSLFDLSILKRALKRTRSVSLRAF